MRTKKRNPTRRAAQPRARLTPRQRRFVQEYVVDLNATAAATRSGYSTRAARAIGCENLTKPNIARAIKAALEARAARTAVTADRVLEELALLAFSSVEDYQVTDAGEVVLAPTARPGAMRALQSIKHRLTTRGRGDDAETVREVEIRLWDKPGPLRLAGQHLGLFIERHHVEADVSFSALVLAACKKAEGDHA
ncbi:MAG: terminase small subunit [Vicinamibacterales bacterium]